MLEILLDTITATIVIITHGHHSSQAFPAFRYLPLLSSLGASRTQYHDILLFTYSSSFPYAPQPSSPPIIISHFLLIFPVFHISPSPLLFISLNLPLSFSHLFYLLNHFSSSTVNSFSSSPVILFNIYHSFNFPT